MSGFNAPRSAVPQLQTPSRTRSDVSRNRLGTQALLTLAVLLVSLSPPEARPQPSRSALR